MSKLQPLIIVLLMLPCCFACAQSSTLVADGEKRTVTWNEMANRLVDVDGLAWGAFEKGLGAHVVLPRGKVYIKNVNLLKSDLNGRLVRVTGILRKSRVDAAPKGVQGYSKPFEYFYLDVIQVSRIEKIELDQLLPSKNDWVVPGMSAKNAATMIRSRNLDDYPLALAASKDGSTTHSYLITDGIVLAYRVLNGRVTAVSKIKLNGTGRLDDEWIQLRGLALPPIRKSAR